VGAFTPGIAVTCGDDFGSIIDDAACPPDLGSALALAIEVALGAAVNFGTALPPPDVAEVVLTFEAAFAGAEDPGTKGLEEIFDKEGLELLPGSALRFRFTVFFLVVVPTTVLASTLPFLAVALDFAPTLLVGFLFVVLVFDAAEVEFPAAVEDAGFGGGAIPNKRSSSKILSSGANKEPPILDNLRRFD